MITEVVKIFEKSKRLEIETKRNKETWRWLILRDSCKIEVKVPQEVWGETRAAYATKTRKVCFSKKKTSMTKLPSGHEEGCYFTTTEIYFGNQALITILIQVILQMKSSGFPNISKVP